MKTSTIKPGLLLVCGLPASGKTWFARALTEKLGAVHINSDAVRTEMGLRGQYDPAAKQRVYDVMFERGETALKNGQFVIADSTFYKETLRQPWQDLADKCGVPCYFIEIRIPEAVALERLQKKREDSEADREVYQKLKAAWEKIEKPHLTLDSDELSMVNMVRLAEIFLIKHP